MVTLAGLEPAPPPGPNWKQGRSVPLELQRRYDPYNDLWRRKGRQKKLSALSLRLVESSVNQLLTFGVQLG